MPFAESVSHAHQHCQQRRRGDAPCSRAGAREQGGTRVPCPSARELATQTPAPPCSSTPRHHCSATSSPSVLHDRCLHTQHPRGYAQQGDRSEHNLNPTRLVGLQFRSCSKPPLAVRVEFDMGGHGRRADASDGLRAMARAMALLERP
jgi:hypothetical protein